MNKNKALKKAYQESKDFRVEKQTKFERALEGVSFGTRKVTTNGSTLKNRKIKEQK